jgi:ABC-2 type transport system permease protein
MNPPTDAAPELPLDSGAAAAATVSPTRPFYWSVRRELWENRSIYVAPLLVAALVLFGTLLGLLSLPEKVRALAEQATTARRAFQALRMAPAPIMLTTFLIGMFYALDALYGERRDRSLLFWKSMPVSDTTTVLAKAAIPLLVLPLIGFALSASVVAVLLLAATLILLGSGVSPAPLWAEVGRFREPVIMFYGLAAHALWFAPIYGWLLLVSGWARRLPFLWATLPPLAIMLFERIAFDGSLMRSLVKYRLGGALEEAFRYGPGVEPGTVDELWQLTPGRFLSSPGLWSGLLFAAACLVAAIRLRRGREPT